MVILFVFHFLVIVSRQTQSLFFLFPELTRHSLLWLCRTGIQSVECGAGARFSKVPKLFGRVSGDLKMLCILKRKYFLSRKHVNRLAFQDKWIKLPLEPKKFTDPSFVLFHKHGRHAKREKNKQKPRKQIDVVFISCISGSITLSWH